MRLKTFGKKAVSLLSYPFLAGLGLAIGYGVLLAERRLKYERRRQAEQRFRQQERKRNSWLTGTEDDYPEERWPGWPEAPR